MIDLYSWHHIIIDAHFMFTSLHHLHLSYNQTLTATDAFSLYSDAFNTDRVSTLTQNLSTPGRDIYPERAVWTCLSVCSVSDSSVSISAAQQQSVP